MKNLAVVVLALSIQASSVAAVPVEVDTRNFQSGVAHSNYAQARAVPVLYPRNDTAGLGGNLTISTNGTVGSDVSTTQDAGLLSIVSGLFSLFNIGHSIFSSNKKSN